jgi:hypothetical protein
MISEVYFIIVYGGSPITTINADLHSIYINSKYNCGNGNNRIYVWLVVYLGYFE